MQTEPVRPWYKKKRFLIPLGLISVISIGAGSSSSSQSSLQTAVTETPVIEQTIVEAVSPVLTPTVEQISPKAITPVVAPKPQPVAQPSQLSNDNYYTNVDGNNVHSPAYSPSGCQSAGASAECRDGTCSFSQHRSGTCSHHGGVANWF